ncbi:suppressor of fused domain protein [Actinomadura rudentiformis]|uniref:Suppressor of fused domain protein n=1 Tax=Actinomadura rudentiformis TaxID=359158 RepID=A0A6H9Z056_9ACTN|nr:suppressor of fused domain protein [Actinomadura rudentiformis]KAB2348529.1 suppressor of fused domain protein [Actinomadura rudentiformis]
MGIDETDESPGWAAIDAALARVYGDAEPHHWGTILKWSLGGPDPLDGISVYPRDEPVPHWHYVSYGMTELYDKHSENPDESGWGFEFTFRLARQPGETTPPVWAANLLQNLGRYVFNSGNWFESGHHMDVNGPIASDRDDSAIRAIAFILDPELGEIGTPHGSMQFLQIVGLATEEYEAARQWRTESLLEVLAPRIPLYVTDIDRGSLLDDPELAATVAAGIERDGSSAGLLYVTTAHWESGSGVTTLRVGALQATSIAQALRGRLPHGNELILKSEDSMLRFAPGDTFTVAEAEPGVLHIDIPLATLNDFTAALRPQAGSTPVATLPGLVVEVVPTAMRDEYGNETGEVIG